MVMKMTREELIEEYEQDLTARNERIQAFRELLDWAIRKQAAYRVALVAILATKSLKRAQEIAAAVLTPEQSEPLRPPF